MRVRALAYSLFLCGLLAYLSFRIHMAPSQVELRLERDLGEYLTVRPRVDGGEQPSLGHISARGILVPASPPLDERNLLGLEEVRINDPRSARAFRRVLASESAGAAASSFWLHARKASLWLDHSVEGAPGSESHRWNFDLIPRAGALDRLGERRAQALVDRIELRIQELRAGRPRVAYGIDLADAEVRIASGVVAIDADVLEGPSWSGGRVFAEWPGGGSLRLRGRIEDFHSLEPWLPLFPEPQRRMLEVLQPSGAVSADVDELVTGREGIQSLIATVRHYDTALRAGGLGRISRLQGEMKVAPEGLSMGRDGPPGSGEILGLPVAVTADVSASRARLELAATRLSIETIPVEQARPGSPRRPLQALWAGLGPRGLLTGVIRVGLAPGEAEDIQGEARIQELALAGVPAVSGAEVSFRLQTEPGGRPGAARGKVAADVPLAGLGRLRGEAQLAWENAQARLTLYDMRWEPPSQGSAAPTGSVFGTLAWSLESGLGGLELRWTGGGIATRVLSAAGFSGQWRKAEEGSSGNAQVGAARIPGGLLGPEGEDIEFERGDASLLLDGGKLRIASLRLMGERRALRATGTLSAPGALDLVVLIGTGPTRSALQDLPHESRPADWLEAARGSFRAFRVTGTPAAPVAREIGELDPAFVRS